MPNFQKQLQFFHLSWPNHLEFLCATFFNYLPIIPRTLTVRNMAQAAHRILGTRSGSKNPVSTTREPRLVVLETLSGAGSGTQRRAGAVKSAWFFQHRPHTGNMANLMRLAARAVVMMQNAMIMRTAIAQEKEEEGRARNELLWHVLWKATLPVQKVAGGPVGKRMVEDHPPGTGLESYRDVASREDLPWGA